jgi:hypothetical protein
MYRLYNHGDRSSDIGVRSSETGVGRRSCTYCTNNKSVTEIGLRRSDTGDGVARGARVVMR